jgi:hypothetical protein
MNHPNRSWRRRLADEAAALGPDLVSAWIALFTRNGEPLVELAAELAQDCGRRYDSNQLLKWRRGAEPVPPMAAHIMRRDLLQYLLDDEALGLALARLLDSAAAQRVIEAEPSTRRLPVR